MKYLASFVFLLGVIVVVKADGAKSSTVPPTTVKSATTVDAKNNKTANLTFSKNLKANDSVHNRFNAVATECKKELNANQEIMALLSSGALPTNEKQRCFLECVYNKVGLIKDGKVNEEGAMSLAKAKFGENKDLMTKAEALFKKCKTEAVVEKDSKEKCALGRLIRTCIVNHGNNLPIFSKAS
uniref:Odorant-binding protein n=1 Tax=Phenacoccus solenopsis TaxID=483260 RepID=A0A0U2NCJ1_9HEMI|nr:odorant-binding protein [Phenacoccus solenopsis]